MKVKVIYSVQYVTEIDVENETDIDDAIQEIDIPENETSSYVEGSFDANIEVYHKLAQTGFYN